MSKFKVAELKAGMRFDQPVYIEGENILVPAEIPIKQKDIDRLLRWEIEDVYTDGKVIGEVAPAESTESKEAASWFPFRDEKFYKVYRSSVGKMEVIFQDINEGTSISYEPIDAVVNDLLGLLRDDKNETIQLIFMGGWAERSMGVSAVNCLIVATVIPSVVSKTMRARSARLRSTFRDRSQDSSFFRSVFVTCKHGFFLMRRVHHNLTPMSPNFPHMTLGQLET